jgi:hypothetical protein
VRRSIYFKPGAFGLVLGLLIASMAPAWARCERGHIPWRYGQQVSSVWHTDGAVCTDVPNEHQYIAQIRITERPQHGILGKAGTFGLAYKPNPGFKGTDSLSFAFVSNNSWQGGAGQVANVSITIIVE